MEISENLKQILEKLKKEGYQLSKKKKDISIKEKAKIIKEIEKNMQLIGGEKFLEITFSFFKDKKNEEKAPRYPIFYYSNNLNTFNKKVPWNFLINIALKFLKNDKKKEVIDVREKWVDIIRKSELLTLEISDSFLLEGIPVRDNIIMEDIKKRIYIDNIILLNQYHYPFFKGLCYYVQEKFEKKYPDKIKKSDYIEKETIKEFLEMLEIKPSVSRISVKEIPAKMMSFFKKISLKNTNVNLNYFFPDDLESINSNQFPFIELENQEEYFILDKSIIIYSFYIKLMEFLTKIYNGNNFDKILGEWVEKFIIKKMKDYELDIHSGFVAGEDVEVSNINETHQCDAYFYTSNKSLLFEIKKKALINRTQVQRLDLVISDLGMAIIDSQIQLIKRKLSFLNSEELKFYDKKCTLLNSVKVNSDYLRPFSITLDNFNSLGEKFFIGNYITKIIDSEIKIEVVKNKNVLFQNEILERSKKINEKNKELKVLIAEYSKKVAKDCNSVINLLRLEIGLLDVSTLFDLLDYLKTLENNSNQVNEVFMNLLNTNRNVFNSGKTNFCNYWENLKFQKKNIFINNEE